MVKFLVEPQRNRAGWSSGSCDISRDWKGKKGEKRTENPEHMGVCVSDIGATVVNLVRAGQNLTLTSKRID